jgi:hypothetical protein
MTVIDVALHLTAGRGGRFEPRGPGELRYVPSGAEPSAILLLSESGLFPYCRPADLDAVTPMVAANGGRFLTTEAIDQVRRTSGSSVAGGRAKLDFDRQVLPLVVLEMAYLHYGTLYGRAAAAHLGALAEPVYRDFLNHAAAPVVSGQPRGLPRPCGADPRADCLSAVLDQGVEEIATVLEAVLTGRQALVKAEAEHSWSVKNTLLHWIRSVFGPEERAQAAGILTAPHRLRKARASWASPWRLEESPLGNRFSSYRQDLWI